ncbi:MAG: tyrosine recombinase XerC [Verrucomicrobiota bacterium]
MTEQDTAKKVAKKWPSDHVNHWKDKVDFQKWTKDGRTEATANLYVRIQLHGKRQAFNLGTSNREEAAKKARDLYVKIKARGWDAVKPQKPSPSIKPPTVGDVIQILESRATHLAPNSLAQYAIALRQLASQIEGISASSTGRKFWRVAVDRLPLTVINAQSVREWRTAKQKKIEKDRLGTTKAINSINSILRNARACFSGLMQPHFRDAGFGEIQCPFKGVKFERGKQSRAYRSNIDAQALINSINNHPDFKIRITLLLALTFGLRRSEIDRLRWDHIDLDAGEISIQTTEEGSVKSVHSERVLGIPDWFVDILAQIKPANNSKQHIITGTKAPSSRYRAENVFKSAIQWLRSRGISGTHPLHTLRKEFGSHIATTHGLHAAAKLLGHADFSNVTALYVDAKGALISTLRPSA